MFVKKKVKDFWNKRGRGREKCILMISRLCKGAQWNKQCNIDIVCDFKIKSRLHAWSCVVEFLHADGGRKACICFRDVS